MKAKKYWVAPIVLAGVLAGCQVQTPGRTRHLGAVSYGDAFSAATEVLSQYYVIAETNPDTGQVKCRPKAVDPPPERILGRSPARHQTTLRLRRDGTSVYAQVSVAIQRQTRTVRRQMPSPGDNYDEVPNKTPSLDEAATTVQQNDTWVTQAYAHDVEIRILDDIYKALHPADSKK
ncbi:MAG: hypothetical protein IIB99_08280 [Planctomycetes bacterium]|nr:hypothetical protein [Planctomycetota bacterium]